MKHLKKLAAKLDDHGRGGDTIVAHINPREAALLKALGGSGSVNPKTGLLEFFSESDPMGGGNDYGMSDGLGGNDPMGGGTDYSPASPDYSPPDVTGLGLGNDPSAAMLGEDRAAAPDLGFTFGGNELAGAQGFGRLGAFAGRQADKALANPIATGINTLASFTPIGLVNTISGWVGGPTVGGMATAAGRALSGGQGSTGQSAGTPTAEAEGAGGPLSGADYGSNASGDGGGISRPNTALANALMGAPQTASPFGRQTFGSLVNSYDPNGRQYVTPWAYRG
jgi:hypothetical protein